MMVYARTLQQFSPRQDWNKKNKIEEIKLFLLIFLLQGEWLSLSIIAVSTSYGLPAIDLIRKFNSLADLHTTNQRNVARSFKKLKFSEFFNIFPLNIFFKFLLKKYPNLF